MTVRPDIPSNGSATAESDTSRGATSLLVALALAALGAVLIGLGPVAGVVTPDPQPAYLAWPVLLVLALLAPGLALWLRSIGRRTVAAAVLIGAAALTPGRLVLDTQLAVDASMAARPELLRPERLQAFSPGIGLWLLLAGHGAVLVAGLLAARALSRETAHDGPQRQGLLALVLCTGVLAAVGTLMAPFESTDPYLVTSAAIDAPWTVLVGSLLVAIAVPVMAGTAVGATDPDFSRGGLLGLAAALFGVVLPPLLAAGLVHQFHYGWGPVFGVVAAVALAVLAVPAGRARRAENADRVRELRLPGRSGMFVLTGVLAALTGVLCVLAALTSQLELPARLDNPAPYPARLLWPAGGLLIVLGAGMFPRGWNVRLRPVLSVVTAAVPLAGAAVLDTVFTAMQVPGAQPGPGSWITGSALVCSLLTALASALTGSVERDDVDLTEMAMRRDVLVPALGALVLGAGAFSFPVLTAPEYTPPGVFAAFGTTSWGLLIAMISVVAATALAPLCRPSRAAAVLGGAALVVAVRTAEFPLTAGRVDAARPGLGLWLGVACLVVLVVTAVLAGRGRARAVAEFADGA